MNGLYLVKWDDIPRKLTLPWIYENDFCFFVFHKALDVF